MPPKAGRGKGKRLAGKYRTQKRKAEETEDLEAQENSTESPSREKRVRKSKKDVSIQLLPPRNIQPESTDVEDEPAFSALSTDKSKSKSQVGNGKGDKGKGKAQNENPHSSVPYSFTEEEEEGIARWIESNKLLYDMKDIQYKDKALRRKLWEGKAAEYGLNYDAILKWYHTQRTRFSKLREGQPIKKSQKRSGDGVSSGDEEDPILVEEASENDSDRDRFIRRVFGFLKPHIRRHKKDTPASFMDKLALAETGEVALSDDSTMTGSLADKPREHTKKYTGYPTPRLPSRTRKTNEDRPESPTMEMGVTGKSHDLQDRLVEFITREQQVSRATPFCKYLEAELDRLHDACMEPAYDETFLTSS